MSSFEFKHKRYLFYIGVPKPLIEWTYENGTPIESMLVGPDQTGVYYRQEILTFKFYEYLMAKKKHSQSYLLASIFLDNDRH